MAHPKLCPCPNCAGSAGFEWLWLAILGGTGVAVTYAIQAGLVAMGKTAMVLVAGSLTVAVTSLVVMAIRGAVRSAREAVTELPAGIATPVVQGDPEPGSDAHIPEVTEPARLRLVRRDEVA